MPQPLILQCSPRPRGNSAYAAEMVRRLIQEHSSTQPDKDAQQNNGTHRQHGQHETTGQNPAHADVTVLRLCDYTISPCIGCDVCAIPKSHKVFYLGCPLSKHDQSETVFRALLQASTLYIISPIYHYHLPAQAKALLDRLQPFYWMHLHKVPFPPDFIKGRRQISIFVAGQPQGKKLFEGSILTLRYSFQPMGYETKDNLGLRGLDAHNDLRDNPEAQALITDFVTGTLNRQTHGLSANETP